ncbi:MAG: hypothetical protein HYV63_13625 [Candidatus Schekmanbacteria bacterium]|nr:hypothetical protein [Candidatus Schekmanbacteria bacterium]
MAHDSRSVSAALSAEAMAGALARIHVDAAVPGETDLGAGLYHFADAGLPWVAANLVPDQQLAELAKPAGVAFVQPYVLLEARSTAAMYRVAVVGAVGAQFGGAAAKNGFALSDPVEAIARVVAELDGKRRAGERVDLVIAISHAGLQESERLARSVAGIDLVLAAHGNTRLPAPQAAGDTYVAQYEDRGRFVLELRVTPKADGEAPASRPRVTQVVHNLDESRGEDPEVAALVAAYKQRLADPAAKPQAGTATEGCEGCGQN